MFRRRAKRRLPTCSVRHRSRLAQLAARGARDRRDDVSRCGRVVAEHEARARLEKSCHDESPRQMVRRKATRIPTPLTGGGCSKDLLPSSIAEDHPLSAAPSVRRTKKPLELSIRAVEEGRRESLASICLYVRGSAPYAVEPKLSRIRSRLDSTGPGNPLGSLDLSGQRHVCRMDASPNEVPC